MYFSIPRPNRKFLAVVLAQLYTFPSREISLEAVKLARSVESIGDRDGGGGPAEASVESIHKCHARVKRESSNQTT
jgi:hypothetical protein